MTEFSQVEVVTLAVLLAGGDQRSVDTEDVAVKAHEIGPGRFSWRKYPTQINLELVRVYLSDAKKPDKGELLSGSGRTGWKLTQAGLKWAKTAEAQLGQATLGRGRERSRAGSVDENRWRRERARILSTAAWKRWSRSETELAVADIRQVFRIDSYAVGELRETKIARLRALFEDDDEIRPFLVSAAGVLNDQEGP